MRVDHGMARTGASGLVRVRSGGARQAGLGAAGRTRGPVWPVKAVAVRRVAAGPGIARFGWAGAVGRGSTCLGRSGHVPARRGRFGEVGLGEVGRGRSWYSGVGWGSHGMAGEARQGGSCRSKARSVPARQSGHRAASQVKARCGSAGPGSHGTSGLVPVVLGWLRHGVAVEVGHVASGFVVARRSAVWHGRRGPVRPGLSGSGTAWHGSQGQVWHVGLRRGTSWQGSLRQAWQGLSSRVATWHGLSGVVR